MILLKCPNPSTPEIDVFGETADRGTKSVQSRRQWNASCDGGGSDPGVILGRLASGLGRADNPRDRAPAQEIERIGPAARNAEHRLRLDSGLPEARRGATCRINPVAQPLELADQLESRLLVLVAKRKEDVAGFRKRAARRQLALEVGDFGIVVDRHQ